MKLFKRIAAFSTAFGATVVLALGLAGAASASGESAKIGLKMEPLSGSLTKDSYTPINWQVEGFINTADPTIDPMKEANLSITPGAFTFTPDPKMPVCPDDKIGPGLVSITVPKAIEACPNSIIGNGLATFALGQQTSQPRDGVMLVFNGGPEPSGTLKGRPRIKVYAYSYDVEVGVYSEAVLTKDGHLDFKIPQLTADSSVTSLKLNIPGKPTDVYVASKDITVTLPKGQDNGYAKAKCAAGSWDYSAEFLLGDRDTAGTPIGPTTRLFEKGVEPCTASGGSGGGAKFAAVKVNGPGSVKAGKSATYKVTVKNGSTKAKGGKIKVSGKGVKGSAKFGTLAAGKSKTVKVKVKFTRKGSIKASFKASAGKVSRTSSETIKVK